MPRIALTELESQLDAHVGMTQLLHARGLNAAGRVQIVGEGPSLVTVEVGTHRTVETITFLLLDEVLTEPECTCPGLVRPFCLHVAAAVLAVDEAGWQVEVDDVSAAPGAPRQASQRPSGSASRAPDPALRDQPWRRELDEALRQKPAFERPGPPALAGAKEPHPETGRLALSVEWAEPAFATRGGTASLVLRPLIRSYTGAWIKTGAAWHEIGYQDQPWQSKAEVTPLRARQVALFESLLALHRSGAGRTMYSRYEEEVTLGGFATPVVWQVLAELHASGVPLMQPGKPPGEVHLHEAVSMGLVLDRDGDELALSPRLTDARGETIEHAVLLVLGERPHGVAWFGPVTDVVTQTPALHLAPFDQATLDSAGRLAKVPLVRVPAADEADFVAEYLPALAEQFGVAVTDPTIRLPEVGAPTLEATVRLLPEHRAEVDWQWRYPVGDDVRRFEPGKPSRWRDAEAEAVIVARVAAALAPVLPAEAVGAVTRPLRLRGIETAMFATKVLPVWQADDDVAVDVDLTGPGAVEPDRYRLVEGAPTVRFASQERTDRDWFDLGVTVTVPGVGREGRDEEVPFSPLFTALAQGQRRLLLPSGTVVNLAAPELAELAELIAESRELHDTRGPMVRLSRLQGGLFEELDALGVLDAQANEWRASVRALTSAAGEPTALGDASTSGARSGADAPSEPIAVPAGVTATLRDYQRQGLDWLIRLHGLGLGGVLADDMGLGKTLQVLALICHVREREPGAPPFLVVAPASVTHGWAREAAALTPGLRVAVVTATRAKRGVDLADLARDVDVVVTSYTLFRLDAAEYEEREWSGLVLDEAQFAKNHTSHAYRGAKALRAPFKLAVTGTPLENHLGELWSLVSIAAPGLFPRRDRFTEFYRHPIERAGDQRRLALLRRRIGPLMLRRTKADVLAELPDKQEQVVEVELNPAHRRAYQTLLNRERRKVLGLLDDLDSHRIEVLRSLTLLRQAAIDSSLVDEAHAKVPSTKLDAVGELLADALAEGHKVLVFSTFTRFLGKVRDRLTADGVPCCYLDGGTRDREAVIESFRAGDAPVFLISLKAGGFGLNLTEADYCVLLDPWWNPAAELQAVDRAHRIGQTRKVMVYRLVAKDTIEEKVMAMQAEKSALFAGVMSGAEFAAPTLDAAAIRGLLAG